MLKLIRNLDSKSYFSCEIREEMFVKGFLLVFSGQNAVATATVAADIGRIQSTYKDVNWLDLNYDFLAALNNLWGGFPQATSVANNPFRFASYIPCGWKGDDNCYHIRPSDNFRLNITMNPGYATNVLSGNDVRLYADIEQGLQKYILQITENTFSLTASQPQTQQYSQENTVGVYLSDVVGGVLTLVSSPLSQAQLTLGGSASSSVPIADLIANTSIKTNVEALTQLVAALYEADLGEMENPSKLEDAFSLYVLNGSGGAATPHVCRVGAVKTADRLVDTAQRMRVKLSERLRAKRLANQPQAAKMIKAFHPDVD